MTSNQIKLIACVSMLIDHIGLIFFPEIHLFRWIGRLAMPLFAFFIAEGCYYTSSPMRYFRRMFCLGVLCQLVYTAEQLLRGELHSVYLNILFTFSISALFCFALLIRKRSVRRRYTTEIFFSTVLLIGGFLLLFVFDRFCTISQRVLGVEVSLDYGIAGVLLPLFALPQRDRKKRMRNYAIGVILFALLLTPKMPYIWFSLLALPILWYYNGTRGDFKYKSFFYLFYPLHLAVLYGIHLLIG